MKKTIAMSFINMLIMLFMIQIHASAKSAIQPQKVLKTGDGTQLLGCVYYDEAKGSNRSYQGFYSFHSTTNPEFCEVGLNEMLSFCDGGGAIIGNKFYFVFFVGRFVPNGTFISYRYVYDFETGEIEDFIGNAADFSVGGVVAYDVTREMSYGLFYDRELRANRFASMDYLTWKRTDIGFLTNDYVSMSFDGKGNLYGIGSDGNVYHIDMETLAESFVCETGIMPGSDRIEHMQTCTISPKTGKMYWCWVDENSDSGLAEINLEKKTCHKVCSFGRKLQFSYLHTPEVEAVDDAPAIPTDLTVEMKPDMPNNLDVSFVMPTCTFVADTIMGDVGYVITLNNEQVATGTAESGAMVNVTLEDMPTGMDTIRVAAVNEAGVGVVAGKSLWVGHDIPQKVTEATLMVEGGKAMVGWTPPEVPGVHGGYVVADSITYTVVRYPDGVVVADNIADTHYDDAIELDTLRLLSYGIVVNYHGEKSEEVFSNYIKVGQSIHPPYSEDFAIAEKGSLYDVVDANGDGFTWKVELNRATYLGNYRQDADDWLVTPDIHLEAGMFYNFSAVFSAGPINTERVEVLMGQGDDPSAYTAVLVEPADLLKLSSLETDTTFTVGETGNYRIGFHAISSYKGYQLRLLEWGVGEPKSFTAPDSVVNLTVTPAEKGELRANVVFDAPTKCVDGAELTEISKVEVAVGDKVLATLENPTPGMAQSMSVEVPESGMYTFEVTAYNLAGKGHTASACAYIGIDELAPVANLLICDNRDGTATVMWDASTEVGVNGGYVDVSGVAYKIYDVEDGKPGNVMAMVSDNTFPVDLSDADEGGMKLLRVAVTAVLGSHETEARLATIVMGSPAILPFVESFSDGEMKQEWWFCNDGGTPWKIFQDAVDNDGGCVGFKASKGGDVGLLFSSKISVKDVANPTLLFNYLVTPGQDLSMDVFVDAQKKEPPKTVKTYEVKNMTGDVQWRQEVINLSDYVGEDYIIIGWKTVGNAKGTSVEVDNIVLRDVFEHDLSAKVEIPVTTVVGTEVSFAVKVCNKGENAVEADDYTLHVLVNGTELENDFNNKALSEFTGELVCHYTWPVGLFDGEELAVEAWVDYALDLYSGNNKDVAYVEVKGNGLPCVSDLDGSLDGGDVNLVWSAPEPSEDAGELQTEDFEDRAVFVPFSVGGITQNNHWGALGDWTLYDGNGGKTYGFLEGNYYPNVGAPMAYQVFNGEAGGWDMHHYDNIVSIGAHSGQQFLMSICTKDEELPDPTPAGDKWLISPLLCGQEQTISFYTSEITTEYGNEQFEVWVSATDKEINSFSKVYSGEVDSTDWKEVNVALPEGTKYFAIRCVSKDVFGFEVDDITYMSATEIGQLAIKGEDAVTGYNIYRDAEKIASVGADVKSFTDVEVPVGNHVYHVTALFGKMESWLSNEFSIQVPTAIKETAIRARLRNADITVYGTDGVMVAEGKGVYGKLANGVYVIKDNSSGKVSVISKK